MNEETRKEIRRLAENAEVRIARSILRWKYKKEGASPPGDDVLESQSRRVAETARGVISEKGKTVWDEFKKACSKSGGKEDPRK